MGCTGPCSCPLPFLPLTALLHGSNACRKISYTIWGRFHTFQLVRSDSRLPPAFSSARIPVMLSIYTGTSPLPKNATTMSSSVFSGSSTKPTPTFWRPTSSVSINIWPRCVGFLPDTPWLCRKGLSRQCRAQWVPPHHNHRRTGQFRRSVGMEKC